MGFQKKLCTPEKNPYICCKKSPCQGKHRGLEEEDSRDRGLWSSPPWHCAWWVLSSEPIVSREKKSHLLMGSREGQGTCCNYLAKFSGLSTKRRFLGNDCDQNINLRSLLRVCCSCASTSLCSVLLLTNITRCRGKQGGWKVGRQALLCHGAFLHRAVMLPPKWPVREVMLSYTEASISRRADPAAPLPLAPRRRGGALSTGLGCNLQREHHLPPACQAVSDRWGCLAAMSPSPIAAETDGGASDTVASLLPGVL